MNVRNLYPAPEKVSINNLHDNFPPVFEPVNEYLIPNAYINSYGYIFKNFRVIEETISYRHRSSIGLKNILSSYLFKKKMKVNQPAISIMNGWLDSFYHFTLESLIKLYVLREHIDSSTVVFHKNKDLKQFHKEWIEILNLKNVTFIDDNEIVETPLAISCTFTSRDLNHHNIVVPEFRNWILSRVENDNVQKYKKIFIGRKNARHRNILNLEEVRRFLEEKDFVYLEMENFNLKQQINIFRNADKIIALHGAALTHLCFAKPTANVIDLIHEDFNQLCFYKLAKVLGINYIMLGCAGSNIKEQSPGHQDLIIDLSKLEATIDKW